MLAHNEIEWMNIQNVEFHCFYYLSYSSYIKMAAKCTSGNKECVQDGGKERPYREDMRKRRDCTAVMKSEFNSPVADCCGDINGLDSL